jgi:hypothetical protein
LELSIIASHGLTDVSFLSAEYKSLYIKQNSVKRRSYNLEIPTIQHLKRVVPDWKSFMNETGRIQKHVQKGLNSVCASLVVVQLDPSSPTPLIFQL